MKFKKNPIPGCTNELLNLTKNCFVSYNAHPHSGNRMFESEGGCAETALCIDGDYLVLNGDFRREYLEAAEKDVAECLEVYKRHRDEHKSIWSSDKDDLDYERLLIHLLENYETSSDRNKEEE